MAAKAMSGEQVIPQIDEGLSGVSEDEAIRCDMGCRKVFQSNADRNRHIKLVHRINYEWNCDESTCTVLYLNFDDFLAR